jgi:hypothetical protein
VKKIFNIKVHAEWQTIFNTVSTEIYIPRHI